MRKLREADLQISVIQYLDLVKPNAFYFHVPNSSMATPGYRKTLKRMGLKAGIGDLLFILPGGRLGVIELKLLGGKQSGFQETFEAVCNSFGVDYRIAHSIQEVADILREWDCL